MSVFAKEFMIGVRTLWVYGIYDSHSFVDGGIFHLGAVAGDVVGAKFTD